MPVRPLLRTALLTATLLCSTAALAAPHAKGVTLLRSDSGKPVAAKNLGRSVLDSGIVARLPEGASLTLFDISLTAREPSAVMLSASSEFLTAAVLTGSIASGSQQANAGQLLTWPMDSKEPQRFSYDLGRLLASSSPAIDAQLRADMEPVLQAQQRAIFWGKLQPAGANVRAPMSPALESLRREYLFTPAAIEARRAGGGDQAAVSREVAEQFVAALARRDSVTVADLLDPSLFQKNGTEGWMEKRDLFAKNLTSGNLPARLKQSKLEAKGDLQWDVRAGKKTYLLEQSGKSGSFPFVTKLEATH